MSYKYNKTWRKKNNAIWQRGKKRYYKQFEKGAHNKNQTYTIEEINMIMNKEYLDREISKKIGRSVKALQVKRARLNNFKNQKNIV